ncbi:RNI-like protein, partial [Auricularia subglabra TFB-10046 SS5]
PVVFSLKGKGLRFNDADDLAPYLKEVPDLSKVTEICLSGNTLGVKAANALAESIRGMSSLRVATLSDLFTGRLDTEIPMALAALCEALTETQSLIEFNVSDNAIGKYVDALVPLFSKNHSIRVIKLNNLGFGPYAGNIVAEALIAAVSQGEPSNLRVMISGRHHIENGAAPAWGRMFAAHGGLTGVDMQSAWIGAAGFKEIANGLAHCKGLRHLNLDDNLGRDSEDDGWSAFAGALRSWTRLRFCNVASCKMENEGAQAILDVLAEGNHKELHTLVMDNSDLTEEVYSQLRDVVEHHLPALRILSIADNDDIEENEAIAAIERIMEEREGELILEEDLDRRWPEPIDELDSSDEDIKAPTANTDVAADAIASEIRVCILLLCTQIADIDSQDAMS